MIRAVIFDMDGTLIDTEGLGMRFWTETMGSYGFDLEYDFALGFRGLGKTMITKMVEERYQRPFDYDFIHGQVVKRIEDHVKSYGLMKKPGADEALRYLRDRGYKLAVATATEYHMACKRLEMVGLKDRFDDIISADAVRRGKPYPDIYLYASQQILDEKPENCVAVEDAPNGVLSASGAGCKVVMVPDLSEPDEALKQLLFARIDRLDGLCDII